MAHQDFHVAIVYIPVPKYPLSDVEKRYSRAFFQAYAKSYLEQLTEDDLRNLWQVEKVNQGLLYIASYLQKHDFEVSYFAHGNNPYSLPVEGAQVVRKELLAELYKYDLICLYCITCNYHLAESLASDIKKRNSNVIVALGGPHASAVPHEVLNAPMYSENKSFSSRSKILFDFVGRGEGEDTVLDMAKCLREKGRIEPLAGAVVRTDGIMARGPERPRKNPVDYPTPAYEISGITRLPAARIFPNRGCPNCCAFCADPWKKKVTYVNNDSVAKEVDLLHSRYGTRFLYLGCQDFLCDEKRALEVANVIHHTHHDISWVAQSRVKPKLSNKTLEKLVQYGCVGIEFGVESADQAILDTVKKNISLENAKNCFQIAKESNLLTQHTG